MPFLALACFYCLFVLHSSCWCDLYAYVACVLFLIILILFLIVYAGYIHCYDIEFDLVCYDVLGG